MTIQSVIKEPRHAEFFAQALKEMRDLTTNAAFSMISDSVAVNRQLAEFLIESRQLVEDEAVLAIDAMTLAFDGKSEKLSALKAATNRVSAETAFMRSELAAIDAKTKEIERLTGAIDSLSSSLERFSGLVADGTLEQAASAAKALAHTK